MDIKAILTESGVQEEAIAKAEKAISKAIGDEFVAKQRYKDKLDEIATLTDKLATAEDSGATAESWKAKYDEEAAAHAKTKSDHEAKETLSTKRSLARESLIAAGVKPDIADDFMLSALDYETITLKDGAIKDADKFIAAQREKYGKYFGTITVEGAKVGDPPANNGGEPNPWKKGDGYSLQKQTELFRKDPDKARQMAAAVGVKL